LAKYEETPGRSKEYCAEYPRALADVTCTKLTGEVVLGREVAIQCQNAGQEQAATAVYNQATLLLKSYRNCLEKYEPTPIKAKEYCAQYTKALQEIGLQIKEVPEERAIPTAATKESRSIGRKIHLIEVHWSFDDPAAAVGDEQKRLIVFRKVRDEIRDRVKGWVAELHNR
jgi:protein-tyrosine-phosphatase